jgi:hypothetical protein
VGNLPVPRQTRQKSRRVFVNKVELGRAQDWHEAEELLWNFAELLFEHQFRYPIDMRDIDRNAKRQAAFLTAMGVPDPIYREAYVERNEVGDTFQFNFISLVSAAQS